MIFTIKAHDTTSLRGTLKDANGSVVNLTGATVNFVVVKRDLTPKFKRAAEITNAAGGQVQYSFTPTDTTEIGIFYGEFEVTYAGGAVETFPNEGHIRIMIGSDLG
ncbi:BppU family phage baseplate upper protein [Paenibacillus sp. HJGM_3]|uniref:BppU family phage baseplate upper protein n=1 Tax=Paenibacillus sp. HJGM_3 TaxID=3379816 RepID=UPI003859DBDE